VGGRDHVQMVDESSGALKNVAGGQQYRLLCTDNEKKKENGSWTRNMNLRFARLGKHEKCVEFDTSNNHPGKCAESLQRARMINDMQREELSQTHRLSWIWSSRSSDGRISDSA
jgi:hypothetical protein